AGTLTDPGSLEARENLYIACLLRGPDGVGAAYVDLSTGDFRLSESRGPGAWEAIALQLATLSPREILHPDGDPPGPLAAGLEDGVALGALEGWMFGRDAAYRTMTE